MIPTNGPPRLETTPADGPFPFIDKSVTTAKLDSQGTLDGHVDMEMRGDSEDTFREVFHGTSRAQWPQVAQNISSRMGFAGSITNLDVSLPEQTDKPFHYAYDYNRKEYADWANRRIVPLMFPVSLSELPEDETPPGPIVLVVEELVELADTELGEICDAVCDLPGELQAGWQQADHGAEAGDPAARSSGGEGGGVPEVHQERIR